MAATQNTVSTAAAKAEKATQTAEQARAALIAAAVAQGKVAAARPAARTKKLGYGVFELLPEAHIVKVNYDERGRETDWSLVAADMTWTLNFATKRDALAWADRTGDAAAQKVAAEKLIAAHRKA